MIYTQMFEYLPNIQPLSISKSGVGYYIYVCRYTQQKKNSQQMKKRHQKKERTAFLLLQSSVKYLLGC